MGLSKWQTLILFIALLIFIMTTYNFNTVYEDESSLKYVKIGFSQNITSPSINHNYETIYQMIQGVQRNACVKTHVLVGENKLEPDVHICLDKISSKCNVYSFGIANNWIFDDFMISRGCQVFSFDPSMNVGKHKRHNNHLFEPIGIGSYSGHHTGSSTLYGGKTKYEVLSLSDIMKRYNHTHVNLIRMDTEFAEWDVLQEWIDDNMFSKLDQLLLEIHMWPKDKYATNNGEMQSKILHNIPMTLFHQARNKHDNVKLTGAMTQVYELGFLKNYIRKI